MRGTLWVATIITFAAGLAGSDAVAQMLSPQVTPVEQLLVLKNGEVLRGQITRNAEQVILHTEQGSRLVLPTERTDFVCNSMDEAYWGKVARTKASDLVGHQRLFHWCLKNKMLDQAQNQIDILLQMNAKAVQLEYLNRQLNVALLQRDNRMQSSAPTREPNPNNPVQRIEPEKQMALVPYQLDPTIGAEKMEVDDSDGLVFRPLPSLNSGRAEASESKFVQLPPINESPVSEMPTSPVRQVNFEEDISFDSISLDHKISSASPTARSMEATEPEDDREMIPVDELDRETRSMPDGSLGHYRQRVERVLTSGCSAANCHGSDSSIMPLLQLGRSQPIPRRQSQRNLHNVLKYVDKTRPMESRLLIAATKPHAGNDTPIIEKGSQHHENLLRWLIMLSDDPQRSLYEAVESERNSAFTVPVAKEQTSVQPIEPVPDKTMPMKGSSLEFPDTIGEIPKLDAVDKGFTPVDPFDPEIFNRNYGK